MVVGERQLDYATLESQLETRKPDFEGVGSTEENISAIVNQLVVFAKKYSFDEKEVFAVRLASEEAVANAYKHAHKRDLRKIYRVDAYYYGDQLVIVVEDEGDGFYPEAVPDPTDDEHLDIPTGRGILLMREYMDLVLYNEKGNKVIMVKKKPKE